MNVTQVTVTIHEKRNHPFEYGHYDASVTLTGNIESNDLPTMVITDLKYMARGHVIEELDLWTNRVKEEKRVNDICENLSYDLGYLRKSTVGRTRLEYAKRAVKKVKKLPVRMWGEWIEEIRQALESSKRLMDAKNRKNEQPDEIPF